MSDERLQDAIDLFDGGFEGSLSETAHILRHLVDYAKELEAAQEAQPMSTAPTGRTDFNVVCRMESIRGRHEYVAVGWLPLPGEVTP